LIRNMRPRYLDLFAAFKDPDPARADAAFDAVLFDRADALPDLYELYLSSNGELLMRYYAVQLMGFAEDETAIPMVIEALADREALVRAEACRALEDLRAQDAVGSLEERVQDVDKDVRRAACEALSALGVPGYHD
jgi:HEAT repeat protein